MRDEFSQCGCDRVGRVVKRRVHGYRSPKGVHEKLTKLTPALLTTTGAARSFHLMAHLSQVHICPYKYDTSRGLFVLSIAIMEGVFPCLAELMARAEACALRRRLSGGQ